MPVPLLLSPAHSAVAVLVFLLLDALSNDRVCNAGMAWMTTRLRLKLVTIKRALRELGPSGVGRVFVATTRRPRTADREPIHDDDDDYVEVPMWCLDLAISARALRLFIALLWWSRPWASGTVGFTRAEMADKLHVSVDTIDRALAELVRVGLVLRVACPGHAATLAPVLTPPPGILVDPNVDGDSQVLDGQAADDSRDDARAGVDSDEATQAETTSGPAVAIDLGGTHPEIEGGCRKIRPSGAAKSDHRRSTPLREPTTTKSPAFGISRNQARALARPLAAGTLVTGSKWRRRPRPAVRQPGLVDVTAVSAVITGLPGELRDRLGELMPDRLVALIGAELTDRTPAELVERITTRWATWRYEYASATGRLHDPVAVATTLIRRGCPDVRCENGLVQLGATTGDTKPCELCAERAADRRRATLDRHGQVDPDVADPTTDHTAWTRRVADPATLRSNPQWTPGPAAPSPGLDPSDRERDEADAAIDAAIANGVRGAALARVAELAHAEMTARAEMPAGAEPAGPIRTVA